MIMLLMIDIQELAWEIVAALVASGARIPRRHTIILTVAFFKYNLQAYF